MKGQIELRGDGMHRENEGCSLEDQVERDALGRFEDAIARILADALLRELAGAVDRNREPSGNVLD